MSVCPILIHFDPFWEGLTMTILMGLPEIQAASKEEAPKAVRLCGKRSWDPISGQQKTIKNTWLWQCLACMFFSSRETIRLDSGSAGIHSEKFLPAPPAVFLAFW